MAQNKEPVYYLQTDPKWANISYSAGGEKTTIGRAGCGPTSMAMVLATWADKSVTPKSEAAWALAHGYKAPYQGTYYSYFVPAAKRYGLTCTHLNGASIYGNANSPHHATAKSAVDNGDLVIACMGKGLWTRSGHYVLMWKVEGNTVFINDPASTSQARVRGSYSLFKTQVKYYWVIKRPQNMTVTYSKVNYKVKVLDMGGLNCRKEPDLQGEVVAVYPYEEVVWLTEVSSDGWGKTDKGWINLKNTERTEDMTKQETNELISEALGEVKKLLPKVYNDREEIPGWYRAAFEKIEPVMKGTGSGLGISEDALKVLTLLDRLGVLN